MRILSTADGSPTILNEELNERYHSLHGALQESMHVFIHAGLYVHSSTVVNMLEMGFGSGLNAWLTLQHAQNRQIHYTALEKYPVAVELAKIYGAELKASESFMKMHESAWQEDVCIADKFILHKREQDFLDVLPSGLFDIVYFDAFSPSKQPELWTVEVFQNIFNVCNQGAIMVTYCSKGDVRRNLISAGWKVEKIPGPPGKREMLRAYKYE